MMASIFFLNFRVSSYIRKKHVQVDKALEKLESNIMDNKNRGALLKRSLKKLKLQV
jgi:hypothetical protein